MRDRGSSSPGRSDRHPNPVVRVPTYRHLDHSLRSLQPSRDQREIASLHAPRLQLLDERDVRGLLLATTRRPDVPLSRRWTIPGRAGPPIGESPVWASSALTSVPLCTPAPGCTTIPAGLFTTKRSSSSYTIVRGIGSGRSGSPRPAGIVIVTRSPARSR